MTEVPVYSPIVLFAYDRPEHLQESIEALAANKLASDSDLIVYSDAAYSKANLARVDAVRAYLKTISGFRSVAVRERVNNFGLAKSIISGVGEVLETYDRIIVLEDDLVTSPNFLLYMNEALEKYEQDERVASIHAYLPPLPIQMQDNFFLRGADCWGWGTWRRGWRIFEPDGKALLKQLLASNLSYQFDCNGSYPFTEMLKQQIEERNNSWAIRWHAAAFLEDKLTLHPRQSLVQNIGNDGSGTHCGTTSMHDTTLSTKLIDLNDIPVMESAVARSAFEAFYRNAHKKSSDASLRGKIRYWLKSLKKQIRYI